MVLAAWALILVVIFPFAGKFESAQSNEPSSFLPGTAESVTVLDLQEQFPGGDVTPAVAVIARDGGLTAADRTAIARAVAEFNRNLPAGVQAPGLVPGPVSEDGTAQLLVANLEVAGDSDLLLDDVTELRATLEDAAPPGLEARVTGPAGISADAIEVFGGINTNLLLATTLIVFVLLLVIYRSPIFWLLPLLAVGVAEISARAFGYLLADNGVVVNGQSAGILLVLVFGTGTDYALLLTARYREELRRNEDKHEAMAIAIRRAGPAILASAGTVIAALLCLLLAEVNGTSGLGPIGAMGVFLAMLVMLTALPALLLLGGRRAFWPFIPRYGSTGSSETQGWWRRLGDRVARRPRGTWIVTAVILGIASLGLLSFNTGLTSADDFRQDVDSILGQDIITRAFPAGSSAPTNVIIPPGADEAAVAEAIRTTPGVSSARRAAEGPPGVQYDVTLEDPPYSDAAYDDITVLRDGKHVETLSAEGLTERELIRRMVGRYQENLYPVLNAPGAKPRLEVRDFTHTGSNAAVNLSVAEGEVLGLYGLVGAGRSDLLRGVFGDLTRTSGEILLDGAKTPGERPDKSVKAGLAIITEDRRKDGLSEDRPIVDNTSLPALPWLSRLGFVRRRLEHRNAQASLEKYGVKYADMNDPVRSLSGGNQQKVVLAKWGMNHPRVYLLDEPTVGVDIGAKEAIYNHIRDLAADGAAVVLVSSYLPEVMGMSHRILVVRNGAVVGEAIPENTSEQELVEMASGVSENEH